MSTPQTTTIVETAGESVDVAGEVELTTVATAGAAAGAAGAHADQAAEAAAVATEAAAGTAGVASIAVEAASAAESAASRAQEAEYATAQQVSQLQETLTAIRETVSSLAERPAPETTPKRQAAPRSDKPPAKTHWLQRKVGGKK